MTDRTTASFWDLFAKLPAEIQTLARKKHQLWLSDPAHASLEFKELYPGLWSVRVNLQYRALGRRRGDIVTWFWIGSHAEYNHLIKRR